MTDKSETVQLAFRLTAEERETFRRVATDAGFTLSAWLRLVARRAAGMVTP